MNIKVYNLKPLNNLESKYIYFLDSTSLTSFKECSELEEGSYSDVINSEVNAVKIGVKYYTKEHTISFDGVSDYLTLDTNNVVVLEEAQDGSMSFYNMYITSYSKKYLSNKIRADRKSFSIGRFVTPFSSVEEGTLELFIKPENLYTDLDIAVENIDKIELYMPNTITISGSDICSINGSIELTLQLSQPKEGIRLELKSDAGHLPVRRIKTDAEGKAIVKFMALGLDAGAIATVKVGFGYFSNVTNKEITIG